MSEERNRSHTRKGPGTMPHDKGHPTEPRRSQYGIRHAQPCIPMHEHDRLVREAMRRGLKRAANAVRAGWGPT